MYRVVLVCECSIQRNDCFRDKMYGVTIDYLLFECYICNHQSHEEFLHLYGGGIRPRDSGSSDPDTDIVVDTSGLPSEVDWRKEGWVGPVGNQVI